jgi:hypothetical protein
MVLTTSWKEEGRVEGLAQSRQEAVTSIVLPQLTRKFGALDPEVVKHIRLLNFSQIEELAFALLDFSTPEDLAACLANLH